MSEASTDQNIFICEINDGYSFRKLIEFLRASNIEGNFVFSKKEITYRQTDGQSVLMNDIIIRTCDLPKYEFNVPDNQIVGVQLADVVTETKDIGKKDGARLYMKRGDINLYIQRITTTKGMRSNIHFVRTKNIDYVLQEFPVFKRMLDEPNTNASLNEFSQVCKNMGGIKCDYVSIQGFSRGVKLLAYVEGQLTGRSEKFGECDETSKVLYPDFKELFSTLDIDSIRPTVSRVKLVIKPNGDIPTVRVPSSIMRALGKMNNICTNGSVKLYIEEVETAQGMIPIMRIVCPIGYYGSLTVGIRDCAL